MRPREEGRRNNTTQHMKSKPRLTPQHTWRRVVQARAPQAWKLLPTSAMGTSVNLKLPLAKQVTSMRRGCCWEAAPAWSTPKLRASWGMSAHESGVGGAPCWTHCTSNAYGSPIVAVEAKPATTVQRDAVMAAARRSSKTKRGGDGAGEQEGKKKKPLLSYTCTPLELCFRPEGSRGARLAPLMNMRGSTRFGAWLSPWRFV